MKQGLVIFTLTSGVTVETPIAIKGDMQKALETATKEIAGLEPNDFYGIGNIVVRAKEIAAVKAVDLTLNLGGR